MIKNKRTKRKKIYIYITKKKKKKKQLSPKSRVTVGPSERKVLEFKDTFEEN